MTAPAPDPGSDHALIPYTGGDPLTRASAWASLPDDELKRRAVAACRDHDVPTLVSLMDAYLTEHGRAGATVSASTRRNYRQATEALLVAWSQQNLLHPARNAGTDWLRHLEAAGARTRGGQPQRTKDGQAVGLAPSSVRLHLAAARTLYAALRWAGATDADPFRDARPAGDKTDPADKRQPYTPEEIVRLLDHAAPIDRALILLAGHAGLRVAEIVDLRWADVDLAAGTLLVRHGKGGKQRHVNLSGSTLAALVQLRQVDQAPWTTERAGYVLCSFGTTHEARKRMQRLCKRVGVDYKGIHALRHAAGTRIVREGGDLERAARHLGHASLETARIYAKWSDEALKRQVGAW